MAFYLRLIELVAGACHQIAATLYQRGDSIHSREVLAAEMAREMAAIPNNRPWERDNLPLHTYFSNRYYEWSAQYPQGVADIVGYWAETRIFGGVAVFDRGISDQGCDGVYFHSDRKNYGNTLYPPTETQLRSLICFLHPSTARPSPGIAGPTLPSITTTAACPLPITPSKENRWRWDPGYAFLQ